MHNTHYSTYFTLCILGLSRHRWQEIRRKFHSFFSCTRMQEPLGQRRVITCTQKDLGFLTRSALFCGCCLCSCSGSCLPGRQSVPRFAPPAPLTQVVMLVTNTDVVPGSVAIGRDLYGPHEYAVRKQRCSTHALTHNGCQIIQLRNRLRIPNVNSGRRRRHRIAYYAWCVLMSWSCSSESC